MSFSGLATWACKSAAPVRPSAGADSAAPSAPGPVVERRTAPARPALVPKIVELPGGEGGIGFDDLAFGAHSGRVIAPAGGTGSLDLVDPRTLEVTVVQGKSVARKYRGGHDDGITSADEARGVLLAVDRTAKLLLVVDPSAKAVVSTASLSASPDYVRYVEATGEAWVTEPDAEQIEIFKLDADARAAPTRAGTIRVKGGPESLVIDATRKRAFSHLWEGSSVAIDLKARAIVSTWPNGCKGSRGIALDVKSGFLFAGCAEGRAVALDVEHGGRELGAVSTGPGVDVIAYSSKLRHLYVPSSKSATLAVIGVGKNGSLASLGTAETAQGAHCVAADDQSRAWVCDPQHGRLLLIDDAFAPVVN